jgi:SAM-dependent methyltransferase
MGFFTLDLLRMVGASGKVVAVDLQPKMLARLKRRAAKAGLLYNLDARLASPASMSLTDLAASVDFTLAFAVVHEFPNPADFFRQVAAASKPGAALLLAEPTGHVKSAHFDAELNAASDAGFPEIPPRHSRQPRRAAVKKLGRTMMVQFGCRPNEYGRESS